jgi:hypothetical protein
MNIKTISLFFLYLILILQIILFIFYNILIIKLTIYYNI